ncbi:hypothetical protein [Arsukibacterium sp.]|uniref:hypothetical protein n=1 Tax=Arsukibacterium sp. TaxID=1977258 RepID=UPI00299DA67C|nr:hypothetical protein [Arsukibacterium sp.]MDX1676388.1 hypothetical protein [Arsukibacterium sp.]
MSERFIELKSQQLVYYVSRFLRGRLAHNELHIFIWDTLEEWSQFDLLAGAPGSLKEQVFWHLMHQLEYWPACRLQHDHQLRRSIQDCLNFLRGTGRCPLNCIGVRP